LIGTNIGNLDDWLEPVDNKNVSEEKIVI